MALTRQQLVTAISVLYLLCPTILAAYALRSAHNYSLPIPDVICAIAIALPPLAGIALEVVLAINERLAAKGQLQTSRIFQVVTGFFLVYESVLATLAGTHISPPGSLDCALRETWQKLFSRHEAKYIRKIQDAFQCCGLGTTKEMAWPFQDANHGADACMVRYEERDRSCLGPWRDEERKVAIMLLIVPVMVFLWKVAVVLAPSSQSGWLPSTIRLPADSASADSTPAASRQSRPAIAYRDVEDAVEEDSLHDEITRLNKDSRLASHIEGNRSKSSGWLDEAARWREED